MSVAYPFEHLTYYQKLEILRKAFELSYEWWFDVLDIKVSYARQKLEIEFEDALKYFEPNSHFTIILRQIPKAEEHIEVGFSNFKKDIYKSYYLWINVKVEDFQQILDFYDI